MPKCLKCTFFFFFETQSGTTNLVVLYIYKFLGFPANVLLTLSECCILFPNITVNHGNYDSSIKSYYYYVSLIRMTLGSMFIEFCNAMKMKWPRWYQQCPMAGNLSRWYSNNFFFKEILFIFNVYNILYFTINTSILLLMINFYSRLLFKNDSLKKKILTFKFFSRCLEGRL